MAGLGDPIGDMDRVDVSLHKAVEQKDAYKVSRLLKQGHNVNSYDYHGIQPLHKAIVAGEVKNSCATMSLLTG